MKKTILTRMSEQKFVSVLHVPKHSESGGGRGHFDALCLFPELLVFKWEIQSYSKTSCVWKKKEKKNEYFLLAFL